MLPRPQRGSLFRSCRRAPSSWARSTSSEPAVPPTRRSSSLPRAIALPPSRNRPPTHAIPPRVRVLPSTPLRAPSQRGLFFSGLAVPRLAGAAIELRVSSRFVPALFRDRFGSLVRLTPRRCRAAPKHPSPIRFGVTSRSPTSTARRRRSFPVIQRQRATTSLPNPTNARCPKTTLATLPPPPTLRRRGRELRAPSPPKATGLDLFGMAGIRRRPRVGYRPAP